MTAIAFGCPTDVRRVPSSGSTATSTSGGLPFPTSSPLKSIGASSFSPSPMTTTPCMATVSSIARMASTAAWSAASLSPRPTQRAQLSAADSVTRTSSSARFRSGATAFPLAMARNLHPLGCFDPHEVERTSDHGRGRPAEREAERLLLALEHAVVVVEAVEVVGDADGVRRQGVRTAALRRLGNERWELGESLDELALRRFDPARGLRRGRPPLGVSQDARDSGVRVLDVVDRVLVGAFAREVDVDVHRLLVAPREQMPAGRVDTDLVEKLVEEDDVPASLRHLARLTALGQVDELVDEDLDLLRIVAERTCDRLQARDVPVVVGPEHVDKPLVPSAPLEPHVRDVDREIRGAPVRAEDHPVLVVSPPGRREQPCSFFLVEVDVGERLVDERLHLALMHPEVHVHAEALER